jgi:hypothetical protein
LAACGIKHQRICLLVTSLSPAGNFFGVLYHKLQTQSSAREDGLNYRPKHAELIEITNKLLLSHLVGCLYYCIRESPSHKYQIFPNKNLKYMADSVKPYLTS